jgi:NADH:ubiquinone reductase (H+-translocating)
VERGMLKQPKVAILGGGFGGLWATRALAKAPVQITLIDRTNHHLFQPLLYQVATAGLSAPDVAAPLRYILRGQKNVTVLMDEVSEINVAGKFVRSANSQIEFDYLIVACGSRHAYFGHDDWAQFAPGLKTLDDALLIRRQILQAFEAAERCDDPAERAALLSFAVIGGGPTGVELAGTLIEIARHTLPREFRHADPHSAQVHLIEAGPRILAAMPENLSTSAKRQLEKLGVNVHLAAAVTSIDELGVSLGTQRIEARTVLWAAGVAASPLGAQLGAPVDRAGRVMVAADLSLANAPNIFVVGDLANVQQDGKAVPGVAPAAKQMGTHAAVMIMRKIRDQPTKPFRYVDFGSLATIGRMAAVVDLHGFKFSGIFAWWFWLTAHLFFLIGFRNRLLVLINWAWSYFTYQRHARVILGSAKPHS